MKAKLLFLAFLITPLITMQVHAQDKNALAQVSFLKAEDLFEQGKYTDALTEINRTEEQLGETNSKILYLKINIFDKLFQKNNNYYSKLSETISVFFQRTDYDIYPKEKYREILRIQDNLESFMKRDSIVSHRLLEEGALESLSSYIQATKNSFYLNKLNNRLKILENQKELDNIGERLDRIPIEIKKARNRKFWGWTMIGAGGGTIAWAISINKQYKRDNFDPYWGESDENHPAFTAAALGGMLTTAGGAFLVLMGSGVRTLKRERTYLQKRKSELSLHVSPHHRNVYSHNSYGLNMRLTF